MEGTLAAAYFSISPESLGSRPRASQPDTQICRREAVGRRKVIRDSSGYLVDGRPRFYLPLSQSTWPLLRDSTLKGKSKLNTWSSVFLCIGCALESPGKF